MSNNNVLFHLLYVEGQMTSTSLYYYQKLIKNSLRRNVEHKVVPGKA